jgi:hypothetical protein
MSIVQVKDNPVVPVKWIGGGKHLQISRHLEVKKKAISLRKLKDNILSPPLDSLYALTRQPLLQYL